MKLNKCALEIQVLVLGWMACFGLLPASAIVLTNSEHGSILECGHRHGLILKTDGTVWGWGNDESGQLGGAIGIFLEPDNVGGDGNWFKDPVRIPSVLGAVSVAAGDNYSLVLKWDGSVLAFGDNGSGQLGLGDTANRYSPTIVPNLSARMLKCGMNFSFAVLPNGTMKAWGENNDGQLGFGSKTPSTLKTPTNVLGVTGITGIAAGKAHALALSSNGTVWAWGDNASGQLGDGSTTDRPTPFVVPNLSGVVAVAAGEAFSMALKTNGTVYVWGEGSDGRLGLGSTADQYVPVLNSSLSNICQLETGSRQGYALDYNGKVWVWGRNAASDYPGIGLGFVAPDGAVLTPTQHVNVPKMVYLGRGGPKLLDGGEHARHVSAGLYEDGLLRIWGSHRWTGGSKILHESTKPKVIGSAMWGYTPTPTSSATYPGAYSRGGDSCASLVSYVLPLDFQVGQTLQNTGGVVTNLLPFFTNSAFGYHYNLSNAPAGGQTNLALRIGYQNPIVAFGSRVGGSALYTERSYRFISYAGSPVLTNDYPFLNDYSNALKIDVYSRTDFSFIGTTNLPIPHYLLTNVTWSAFLTNGLSTSLQMFGLTTTVSTREYPHAYGVTNSGVLELSHMAADPATNYIFVVKIKGMNGNGWMSLSQTLEPVWEPLYTMEFVPAPPWNIRFLSQVQFESEPLPPFYDGKSVEELMSASWVVTNIVQLANPVSSYTNLNHSPELLRHPILDDFVAGLKHDPLALARFVQNEIELTDALDHSSSNQILAGTVRLGGVNRSALGTLLERQGSPAEQCSLLVYLLRQAGVPAVYAFPTNNGMGMLDTRLSKMLRAQLKHAVDPITLQVNTNRLIGVNYPWVVAYIENKWTHLFPWIKDTEIIEGPNVYDFMPEAYNNATKWVTGYIHNRSDIIGLGDPNDPPEVLFPRFIRQQLLTNAPGLSFDELGIRAVNRKKAYNSWDEFPTPTWVAKTNLIADSFLDSVITNGTLASWNPYIFPAGQIFNTARIQVTHSGTNIMDTLTMRCADLHNRPLLIFHERSTASPSSPIRIKMALASYRPGITNVGSFTNGTNFHYGQSLLFTNPVGAMTAKITLTRYRVSGNPITITRTVSIDKGDLNALCLNFGRVTKEMLEPLAETVWNVERSIKADPSLTNSLTADQYHGPLTYLMGMAYYEKVNRFMPTLSRLHKRTPVSTIAIGTARLIAKRNSSGNPPSGPMVYIQPSVDMFFNEVRNVECPTARPDSGEMINNANDSFSILSITDGSAKEHDVINSFYQQVDSVSTVKLLQLAARRHATNSTAKPVLVVNHKNVDLVTTNSYFDYDYNSVTIEPAPGSLTTMDFQIWTKVREAVTASAESQAFVTPGSIVNDTDSYRGTGALIIDRKGMYSALISGNANGGWGPLLPETSLHAANLASVRLSVNSIGNYSINFTAPSATYKPFVLGSVNSAWTWSVANDAWNNRLTYTAFNSQFAWQSSAYLGVGFSGGFNNLFGNTVYASESRSFLGWLSDGLRQVATAVSDPVHAVTGEFYVDTVDLTLVGPLPLEIRRNYSSLNTADNQFGVGWKIAFTPYLSVATNGGVMYAAEPEGSVIAYEATNANVWIPSKVRNPSLVNHCTEGIGSTANRWLSKIERKVESGKTNFYLYSPNGDTRKYQQMEFPIHLGTNFLDRNRPYLVQWTDSRGNALTFSFGTNSLASGYGELQRVDSTSGAYIQFRYDTYGHIVEAYSGDGRHLRYKYDDFGDLVKVILPDASEITYSYQHGTQSVTNSGKVTQEPYSMHLMVEEAKPDGRLIANVYDTQRRVTAQASTVGADLNLVTNALFTYVNDFVLTNSFTNAISGHTLITDVFSKVTRYDYTNSRITKITDPLQQTTEQLWYDEYPGVGAYPRSLWKSKDKRGLWKEFKYDAFGNVTNVITTGNLTGQGGTQAANSFALYNTNHLPLVLVDAIGNSNVFRYDSTFPFLAKETVSHKQGQAMATNAMFYTNCTNVVIAGNKLWTNFSLGMMFKQVRAFSSSDAATNEWHYSGSGFVTNEIRYTSSTDPAITNFMFYNGRGELFKRVDGAGRNYRYDYDGLGHLISQESFEAGQSIPLSWQYFYYNHNGEVNWYDGPQFEPEDYVWTDYDGAGRKIVEARWRSRAKADGSGVELESGDNLYSITSYEYDAFNNLTKQIDPVGNYSLMWYDDIGQMTRQVLYGANGTALATNLMSYEPGGQVAKFTNALGGVIETLYTHTGLPCFKRNADGSTNGWLYDLLGRVVKEIQPNGSYWETAYDDANRKVVRQFKNPAGAVLADTTTFFDRRGNTITNITAEGGVFFTLYDGLDRAKVSGGPATVAGVSTQQVSYTYYDAAGIWVTNQDSIGQRIISKFDAIQRPVLKEIRDIAQGNALVWSESTWYSPDHHIAETAIGTVGGTIAGPIYNTTFTDSSGNTVLAYEYLTGGTKAVTKSKYDAAGRLVESVDALNRSTFLAYDGLGRVRSRQLPDGAIVTNAYNPEGGLTKMVMPGGLTWSATYNNANHRTSEKLSNGASVNRQFTNIIAASGHLAGLVQNSVDQERSITTTFGYDAFRRVATNAAAGTQPEHTLTTLFQYDRRGLVTNYVQTSGVNPPTSVSRKLDAYGQNIEEKTLISGLTQSHYTQRWDAGGRRSQLAQVGAGTGGMIDYAYQVNGLMTSVSQAGANYNFGYETSGLMWIRQNPWRTQQVQSRFWNGRVGSQGAWVGTNYMFSETLGIWHDSKLYSYTTARAGTGAWNDTRYFHYNARNQLTNEGVGISTGVMATNSFAFDANRLGVLTNTQMSGALSNKWQATALNLLAQVTTETWNEYSLKLRAYGSAINAASISGTLDGNAISGAVANGGWHSDLTVSPGNHTLAVTANYDVGQYSATATSAFNVLGTNGVTDFYDGAGNVTNRLFTNGKTQSLKWDAAGRLVSLTQRDSVGSGFNWTAIYDALGRRLRTVNVPVVSNVVNSVMTETVDSFYDPRAEFQELAVSINGQRTWKVMGPDLDGVYGSMNGLGGLEATVREDGGQTTPVLNDYFGNVVATISGTTLNWSSTRVSGYGAVMGYQAALLTASTPLAETLVWRSRKIDPSGFYYLGARYYDPVAGRFLSADPAGHGGSWDLYSFANGDPVNQFDADGRFGKPINGSLEGVMQQRMADLQYAGSPVAQMMQSYQQSQTQMARFSSFQSGPMSFGESVSSVLNMTPLVGGFKMYGELLFTGRDMFTGKWLDDANSHGWGAALNFASALPFGALGRGATMGRGIATETRMFAGVEANLAARSGPSYGVSFFDQRVAGYLNSSTATLGRAGNPHFFMPLTDAAGIRTTSEAARASGMAPSVMRAYTSQQPVFGVAFPTGGLKVNIPTLADSRGWQHFLEGGRTAVRTEGSAGGYLLNTTREFVTPGGGAMPSGSVLFQLGDHGEWIILRRY